MRWMKAVAIVLSLTLPGTAPLLAQSAHDLMQQALVKEQAEGDLRAAIALYERIVAEFAGERPLAAKALVQMGQCYEKLGSTEAERAYRRAVRDYADQNDIVEQARARLAAMQRAAQAAEAGGITTRRIHRWARAEQGGLAPTPDGRSLLVMDYESGNLLIRELATGEDRALTQNASWEAGRFAYGGQVSPDGRLVAYTWADEGESASFLRLVEIDGSRPRVLYHQDGCWITSHEWTADGTGLVVATSCHEAQQIMRLSASDGTVQLVRDVPSVNSGGSKMASQDGRYVTYGVPVEADAGNRDIWILDLEGGRNAPVVVHPANDQLVGWAPGSMGVLFLSDRDGTTDLWALAVVDGSAQGPPRLVRRNMGLVDPLGFTRDGRLFYSTYTRWFSTGVAPIDSTTGAVLWESGRAILGSNMPATWSPDGESLAFVQEQEGPGGPGGPYDRPLLVRHLATGSERILAPHIQARNQRWSPNGRFILMNGRDVTIEDEDYHGALYRVDVETGEATTLLDVPAATSLWWAGISAVWSRDGESIIYSVFDEGSEMGRLVRRDLDSGREHELYRDPLLTTRMLAVSPDGRELVFGVRNSAEGSASWISNGGRLLVMDLSDGHVRELHDIREPGEVRSLQWTPDQSHVLFSRGTGDGQTTLWRVPVSGGGAAQMWSLDKDQFGADLHFSPDGRRIAYTTYHQELDVWVMENLGELLAAIR